MFVQPVELGSPIPVALEEIQSIPLALHLCLSSVDVIMSFCLHHHLIIPAEQIGQSRRRNRAPFFELAGL